ncbi:MAG: PilZ domain-containing protein, partial [Deltaproteobacteria bacterium]|nr:PilZ domain-containing protein [Deltaproteobacteria bacterium]
MADIQKNHSSGKIERRLHPRLVFHCKATIRGIDQVVKVTDISLGGFFFELDANKRLKLGTLVDVSMRLPTEENTVRFKAKLVNQSQRGVGCKYVSLMPETREAIRNCFETFKDTMPID